MQRLQLKTKRHCTNISGIGGGLTLKPGSSVSCTLHNHDGQPVIRLDAFVVKKIVERLPNTDIDASTWHHLKKLKLADPNFDKTADIDMLLGATVWADLIQEHTVKGVDGPVAQLTKFGYVVFGAIKRCQSDTANVLMISNEELNEKLIKFWEMETVLEKILRTDEEQQCEDVFVESVMRTENGQYQVDMPFAICTKAK